MHDKIFHAPFPCDRIGRPLKVGDKVVVLCEITAITQTRAGSCDATLTTVYSRPDGQQEAIVAINTGVVDLADYAPTTPNEV